MPGRITVSRCHRCDNRNVTLRLRTDMDAQECPFCGCLYSGEVLSRTQQEYPPDSEADIPFDVDGVQSLDGPDVVRTINEAARLINARQAAEFTRLTGRRPFVEFTNITPEEEGAPVLPEIQPDQWWSPPLPDGFTWYSYPRGDTAPGTISTDPRHIDTYPARIAAIQAWADEHNFVLGVARTMEVFNGLQYVAWPQRLHVSNQTPEDYDAWCRANLGINHLRLQQPIECPLCEGVHPPYTHRCEEAGRTLACSSCLREMWNVYYNERVTFYRSPIALAGLLCSNCGHPCTLDECENVTLAGFDFCADHGQHANCEACGQTMEAPLGVEEPWQATQAYAAVCDDCAGSCCTHCGRFSEHPTTFSADLDEYVCRRCFREALAGSGTEEFDTRASMTARTMRIPTIPGRETIRDCGVEIEGGIGTGDGSVLAEALYEMGLSTIHEVAGYHFGTRGGFAHVERDSSVDWELVIGPMNPAIREDVTRFGRVVRTLRTMVRDEVLKLDLRAGCHVHVGAERVSLDSAFNLNTIFAYVEDVMFRLGAAKWPIHRAIQDSHYSQPVPKESRKLQFARVSSDEGSRYYALSFNNYFNQMLGACNCGAVRYDSWEDCTCNLGKCTFEFRVFNTTANPRKLHAYLALCQAMVAKAISMGKVSDPADEFPALTFQPKRFKDMGEAEQVELIDEWQERLTWLFTELPLTDDERASLRYCVINSELVNVGDEFINNLIPAADEAQVEEVAA